MTMTPHEINEAAELLKVKNDIETDLDETKYVRVNKWELSGFILGQGSSKQTLLYTLSNSEVLALLNKRKAQIEEKLQELGVQI